MNTTEVQTDTSVTATSRPEMIDCGTQVSNVEVEREAVIREKTKEIRTRLDELNVRNGEEMRKILSAEWPEGTY